MTEAPMLRATQLTPASRWRRRRVSLSLRVGELQRDRHQRRRQIHAGELLSGELACDSGRVQLGL